MFLYGPDCDKEIVELSIVKIVLELRNLILFISNIFKPIDACFDCMNSA